MPLSNLDQSTSPYVTHRRFLLTLCDPITDILKLNGVRHVRAQCTSPLPRLLANSTDQPECVVLAIASGPDAEDKGLMCLLRC